MKVAGDGRVSRLLWCAVVSFPLSAVSLHSRGASKSCEVLFFHRRSVLPKVVGDGYVSRLLWCVVALFSSIFGTVTFLRYFQVLLGPISKYKRCVVLCLFPGLNRPNPVAC